MVDLDIVYISATPGSTKYCAPFALNNQTYIEMPPHPPKEMLLTGSTIGKCPVLALNPGLCVCKYSRKNSTPSGYEQNWVVKCVPPMQVPCLEQHSLWKWLLVDCLCDASTRLDHFSCWKWTLPDYSHVRPMQG